MAESEQEKTGQRPTHTLGRKSRGSDDLDKTSTALSENVCELISHINRLQKQKV